MLTAQNIKYSGSPREERWGSTHRKLCVSLRQQLNRKRSPTSYFAVLFPKFPSLRLNSTTNWIICLEDSLDVT